MTEGKIVDTFDGVLLEEVQELPIQLRMHVYSLIASTREVHLSRARSLDKLGKHYVSPYLRFSLRLTLEFLFELPLNLVPLVGPPLFIVLQGVLLFPSFFEERTLISLGYHLGPLTHYRYIQLNGLSETQKKKFIDLNRWRYWLFGLVHVCLQITPVLSIFFLFTSAVGAALWAIEDQKRLFNGTSEHLSANSDAAVERERARGWWGRLRRGGRGPLG